MNTSDWLAEEMRNEQVKSSPTDGLFVKGEVVAWNRIEKKPYQREDAPRVPENAVNHQFMASIASGDQVFTFTQMAYWDSLDKKPILFKKGQQVILRVLKASIGYRSLGKGRDGENKGVVEHIIKEAELVSDVEIVEKKLGKGASAA